MSIRKGAKRASRKSPKRKYPEGYVIPETAIREFVEKLGIHDIEDAAARMQAVADATNRIFEAPIQRVDPDDLRIILRIAAQSKNRRYQQIMKAIIAAIGEGPEGIKAAHLTARRTVEIAFRWTTEYVSVFKQFKDKLRRNRLADASRRSTGQRQLLRIASSSR